MAELFAMPKLGMDMEIGIVGRWLKAEGESFKKGEPFVEVETDKALVEVEAPCDATLLKIICAEGDEAACGMPIAAIGQPGEAIPSPDAAVALQEAASTAAVGTAPSADLFFCMPKLGMDMEAGVIGRWLKQEGDTVQKGEILAEIETDKAVVEVESTQSGTVLKLYYPEGEILSCGTPIAYIGQPGDKIPDLEQINTVQTAESVEELPPFVAAQPEQTVRDRVIASPRARRCAEENRVDIASVSGTGDNGRIVEQDVLDYLNQAKPKVRIPQDEVVPLAGMRKIIASRMCQSLQEMAQTNTRMDVDMTNAVSLRKQMNKRLEGTGTKISYVDILVAACARALVENPQANASWESDGIHYKNYANVGIAVDSERGLVVPVVKDADILPITEISSCSSKLINKARKGQLTPEQMKGGTFTISNLGMFEVDSFTAIVNPPETCILAVGAIVDKPVARDGQVVIRPIMNLCLSYDHRIVDGAPAARFLQCVKHYLENPVWLLM